ncbi:hypothetical protein FRC11_004258 [Ceratobasidium sp. 423]|nr:hypothetical protein FRC11_004258 [Ceratobasidium sp. 423]
MTNSGMAGPHLPARVVKEQQSKEKKRSNGIKFNNKYVPGKNSVVHQLSNKVTTALQDWWKPFARLGNKFVEMKSNQGNPDGAMAWVQQKFITEWWDKYFPEVKGALEDDQMWFCVTLGMGKKIWTYLNNSLRWKDDKTQGKSAARQVKDKAVNKWESGKGSRPDITKRCKLSYSIYMKHSNQQQKEFRGKAMATVKESQELAKIANLEEHEKFTQQYWARLKELFKEGSEMAGIEVCTLVVHETEEGKTQVTWKLSEGIKGFSKSTSLAKSMDALKEFLETMDKFQGGHGCLMWKEIKEVMHYWVNPWWLPKVEGFKWDDLGYLSKGMVLIWLEFFLACLTRVIPPKEHFQFLHILAGPTTIHPSKSQEACQEQLKRDGRLVYVLIFENKVTKCQWVGGMTYNQQAIDFATYITFDSSHMGGTCAPPL